MMTQRGGELLEEVKEGGSEYGPGAGSGYGDWKAPKEDGAVLIWPAVSAERLGNLARENRASLDASGVKVSGVPLGEVRRRVREYVGLGDELAIVTGHQTELHHPGVWVKNIVICRVAEAISRSGGKGPGARAVHLAVDTDQPKHLVLRYPVRAGSSRAGADGSEVAAARELAVTDDPGMKGGVTSAAWTGRVWGPGALHVAELERRLREDAAGTSATGRHDTDGIQRAGAGPRTPTAIAAGFEFEGFGFEPVAEAFLASLRRSAMEAGEGGVELPRMLVGAMHELDWGLGLRYDALLASPLWEHEGFLLLCTELIARAGEYASAYNAALAAYRVQEGIDNPGRPMPDLLVGNDAVELALWLDDLATGVRRRAMAVRREGRWGLEIGGERFEAEAGGDADGHGGLTAGGWAGAERLKTMLRATRHRIAPRALMLTTFARLCLADLFVHGIGGGRYDQVTDRTLRSFWGVARVPGFSVATGTLYFPWAVGRARACVPCVKRAGHRSRHGALGEAKGRYLSAIAGLPRNSAERRAEFFRMQEALREAWAGSGGLRRWEAELEQTQARAAEDAVVFDRELFYALQPRERLAGWIEAVSRLMGAGGAGQG